VSTCGYPASGMIMPSLCETCQNLREVHTARSRFLLCELSVTSANYPKYRPQPVVRCHGFQSLDDAKLAKPDTPTDQHK
jgi:hypothetical protein